MSKIHFLFIFNVIYWVVLDDYILKALLYMNIKNKYFTWRNLSNDPFTMYSNTIAFGSSKYSKIVVSIPKAIGKKEEERRKY